MLQGCGADEESDCDEVRMESRRRFSYEHFDGVGDNASSESRDPPDDFTSEDDDTTKVLELVLRQILQLRFSILPNNFERSC